MNPIIIIPARLAAQRLPGKPLAQIGGEPMIVHVWRRARAAHVGPVVVAAGDPEIVDAVGAAGGRAVLTDPALPSGSDRVLAAARAVDPGEAHDAVLNLQGDMPFIAPEAIEGAVRLLEQERACDIGTCVARGKPGDLDNPNVVKAIVALSPGAHHGRALYFTRGAPYGEGPLWEHLGLYAYRRDALERFCAAPPSPLEKRERLEQLRAMEMGLQVWATVVGAAPLSVDTPADLEAARAYAAQMSGT